MTAGQALLEWARALQDRISRDSQAGAPQLHVAMRLATVLLGTDVQYVQVDLHGSSVNGLTGSITVFTDNTVAIATLDDTMSTATGYTSEGASVVVSIFSRSSLRMIELPREIDGKNVNLDGVWSIRDGETGWPWRAVLQLRYPDHVVTLTDKSGRGGLADFLPSLLQDLATE